MKDWSPLDERTAAPFSPAHTSDSPLTLADAGHNAGQHLEASERPDQRVVMPDRWQRVVNPYHKNRFVYEEATDSYRCPTGNSGTKRTSAETAGARGPALNPGNGNRQNPPPERTGTPGGYGIPNESQ